MSIDLAYTNNDITFSGSNITVTGKELLIQRLQTKFKWFEEEYTYDTTYGIPYFQEILGKKQIDIYDIFDTLTNKIEEEPEVTKTQVSDFDFDSNSRKMKITFEVQSIFGNFELEAGV